MLRVIYWTDSKSTYVHRMDQLPTADNGCETLLQSSASGKHFIVDVAEPTTKTAPPPSMGNCCTSHETVHSCVWSLGSAAITCVPVVWGECMKRPTQHCHGSFPPFYSRYGFSTTLAISDHFIWETWIASQWCLSRDYGMVLVNTLKALLGNGCFYDTPPPPPPPYRIRDTEPGFSTH